MSRVIEAVATDGSCVSERAGDSLFPADWRSSPRWVCAPLGIDLKPFRRRVDVRECRASLGIPTDAFVVGHVGRFVDPKNHSFLLDVAAALVADLPTAKFLLAGTGPLLPEIQSKATALGIAGNISFLGVRSDIAQLMKGAMDAFVLPSRYEGLGLVVMEAQAAGLPCLISEAVPEEADCGLELVTRLPLTASASAWASQLLKLRNRKLVPPPTEQIRSINASISQLQVLYDSFNATG